MFLEIIALTLVLIGSLGLLFFIVRAGDRANKLQRTTFSVLLVLVVLWVLTIMVTDLFMFETGLALWASRGSFFTSVFIVMFYFLFVKYFGKTDIKYGVDVLVVTTLTFFTALASLTPAVVTSVAVINGEYLKSTTGALYLPVGGYFLGLFILSTYMFFNKWRREINTVLKMQMLYIMVGATISIILAMTTNLLFPVIGIGEIRSLGPISLVFFLGFTTYAILRYRFLSVRILLGRLVYSVLLAIVPYLVFYAVTALQTSLWGSVYAVGALISGWIISVMFVILMQYAGDKLERFVNKNIIEREADVKSTADELVTKLGREVEVEKILDIIFESLQTTLRCDGEFVSVTSGETIVAKKQRGISSISTVGLDVIGDAFTTKEILIVADEYAIKHPHEEAIKLMQDGNVGIVASIENEVKIVLILGKKLDGMAYTVEDIQFINKVVHTLSIAADRAVLYKQVQSFASGLQQKVDRSTVDLQAKNEELAEALRKERDMLDILGHELRTPLGIVRNAVKMLLMQKGKGQLADEYLDKYLAISDENSVRLVNILENIFTSTKIDNNRLNLSYVDVDMVDAVADGITGAQAKADAKKLELKSVVPESCHVYGDRDRIQEVVDNLLDNAIKYTDRGGVTVTLTQDNGFAYLAISDTGKGIPAEDVAKLGNKFYRVDTYVRGERENNVVRPGGTGLGLYVIFELAKVMGGGVTVQSEEGKGSTFTAKFPLFTGQPEKHSQTVGDMINQRFQGN